MIIDREMAWHQFAVAIDDLRRAIRACPDKLWESRLWEDEPDQWVAKGFGAFWYLGYHALFWLDLYLTGTEQGFQPPAPFDLVEMQANETLPRTYGREELLGHVEHCWRRCEETIVGLSDDGSKRMCEFAWGTVPFGELLLYTMRHVQEHAAQLHLFLSQHGVKRA
jgi:hypothetical protein